MYTLGLQLRKDYVNEWRYIEVNISSFDIFDKYGIKNCSIILIEEVNCESKDQLLSRERFYIESISCVNKSIPTRTQKEYYIDNKEKHKEQQKQYYEINKEIIKEQVKEYHEENKTKINERKK